MACLDYMGIRGGRGFFSGVSRCVVAGILMVSIGAPWAFLQTAAWVSMAVEYSVREGSIVSGLSQTFDGNHPCELCKAAAKGAATQPEQESEKRAPTTEKMHLILMVRSITLGRMPGEVQEVEPSDSAVRRTDVPALPPPRGLAVILLS